MKMPLNTINFSWNKFDKIKKIPWILGKKAFSVILIILLFELIIGVFIFYQYVVSAREKEPVMTSSIVKFDSRAYEKVLSSWQENGTGLFKTSTETISNPFETK